MAIRLYYKTIIPFPLVVYMADSYELIMSSYTTRAHGIIVKYRQEQNPSPQLERAC